MCPKIREKIKAIILQINMFHFKYIVADLSSKRQFLIKDL